jgi:hypothetical protein
MVGTKVFMAIGALLGEHHSFMHGLESFWVLFWICIQWNGPGKERKKDKEFEDWNYTPIEGLADIKIGEVSGLRFNTISDHFTASCKSLWPCLKELHKVLFPREAPALKENYWLYSQMKAVLEKAREDPDVLARHNTKLSWYKCKPNSSNLHLTNLIPLLQSNQRMVEIYALILIYIGTDDVVVLHRLDRRVKLRARSRKVICFCPKMHFENSALAR